MVNITCYLQVILFTYTECIIGFESLHILAIVKACLISQRVQLVLTIEIQGEIVSFEPLFCRKEVNFNYEVSVDSIPCAEDAC